MLHKLLALRIMAVATSVLLGGCASTSTANLTKTTRIPIETSLFGVDYAVGPIEVVQRDLTRLALKPAFIARYAVVEGAAQRWKLFRPAAEQSLIEGTPVVLIALPRPGVDHDEATGVEDGRKTAEEVSAFLTQHEAHFAPRASPLAVFLNVEGKGANSWETELSAGYYRGWATGLIQHGTASNVDMRPALYMSLRANRAPNSWRNVAAVAKERASLAPVAIWGHDPVAKTEQCELQRTWVEAHPSIMPPELAKEIFAVQYMLDCACTMRQKWWPWSKCDNGYDLSIVRSREVMDRVKPYLLSYKQSGDRAAIDSGIRAVPVTPAIDQARAPRLAALLSDATSATADGADERFAQLRSGKDPLLLGERNWTSMKNFASLSDVDQFKYKVFLVVKALEEEG
jgi:hypothetical protein